MNSQKRIGSKLTWFHHTPRSEWFCFFKKICFPSRYVVQCEQFLLELKQATFLYICQRPSLTAYSQTHVCLLKVFFSSSFYASQLSWKTKNQNPKTAHLVALHQQELSLHEVLPAEPHHNCFLLLRTETGNIALHK